ncbi:MAG: hypothetical protein KBD53_11685 [Candidatus Omnitrophica bacterium]|nr:hypothetical protein [Candidatus Omnitrophota bacterium]
MYLSFYITKYLRELLRPWKLITFGLALTYYIWGAFHYQLPTWDVPISIIMSSMTYIFAPWVVKSLIYICTERPHYSFGKIIVCVMVTYAAASGSYEVYHMTIGMGYHPPTYWINLYYSTLIFLAAGIFWKFEGTFNELLILLKHSIRIQYGKQPVMFVSFWIILISLLVFAVGHSLMLKDFG